MQYEYIGHENYKFLVTVPWKKKINKILAKTTPKNARA